MDTTRNILLQPTEGGESKQLNLSGDMVNCFVDADTLVAHQISDVHSQTCPAQVSILRVMTSIAIVNHRDSAVEVLFNGVRMPQNHAEFFLLNGRETIAINGKVYKIVVM